MDARDAVLLTLQIRSGHALMMYDVNSRSRLQHLDVRPQLGLAMLFRIASWEISLKAYIYFFEGVSDLCDTE